MFGFYVFVILNLKVTEKILVTFAFGVVDTAAKVEEAAGLDEVEKEAQEVAKALSAIQAETPYFTIFGREFGGSGAAFSALAI